MLVRPSGSLSCRSSVHHIVALLFTMYLADTLGIGFSVCVCVCELTIHKNVHRSLVIFMMKKKSHK